jgi:hypothetical protein
MGLFEYKVILDFKIQNCAYCPFRKEEILYENVESQDRISGVVSITKRLSMCMLKNEQIFYVRYVDDYKSDCPLKNNVKQVE